MRLSRIFFEVSMIKGFDGLREHAKKQKVPLDQDSGMVLFMNRRMTAFKVVMNNQYIVYYRNGNRKIPLDALRFLPSTFGGSELEFQTAMRKALAEKLHFDFGILG